MLIFFTGIYTDWFKKQIFVKARQRDLATGVHLTHTHTGIDTKLGTFVAAIL